MASLKKTRDGRSYFIVESEIIEAIDEFTCECDSCSGGIETGYLIPSQEVLFCRRCFVGWQERAHLQRVDEALERRNIELYWELFELQEEKCYA